MFSAHLVFGDVNHSSNHPFVERTTLLERFRRICLHQRPMLNSQSFFDVDNDSIMIGFSNLDEYLSGNDVLRYVQDLHKTLSEHEIDVSFGVNLIACAPEIDWSTCSGIIDDVRKLHMPDIDYEIEGRILRNRLSGDPLIVVSRVLEIAKKTNNPICYSIINGGHFNDFFNRGDSINPTKVCGWENLISPEHVSFLHERGVTEVYSS